MNSERLRDCLETDFRRLRQVARTAALDAPVPSCPGWALSDLVRHVAEVYLYKVEMMRLGGHADAWPPDGMNDELPLELLDRAYAELSAEFAARRPEDRTFTWYDPDQTVGFWIRDMAQETVIHRVDAELAASVPVAAIPDDLAADGIDELLVAFVQYDIALLPDKFADLLAFAGERTVAVVTPQRSWLVGIAAGGLRVHEPVDGSPDATVQGTAPDILLWLWNRGGANITTTADDEAIVLLRRIVATVLSSRLEED